jgi:hypothetical protein
MKMLTTVIPANFPKSHWCSSISIFYWCKGFSEPLVQSSKSFRKRPVPMLKGSPKSLGLTIFCRFFSHSLQGFRKLFYNSTSGFQENQQELVSFLSSLKINS